MSKMILVPPAIGYHTTKDGKPLYDPGIDVPCPFCLEVITEGDVRTLNLMQMQRKPHLSVFYRAHRTCHEKSGEKEKNHLDQIVMVMLEEMVKS